MAFYTPCFYTSCIETSKKKAKKWERTNVTNLLRNRESGNYYARAKVGSKQKWRFLDTDVVTVAKQRLPGAVEELRAQIFTAAGQTLSVEGRIELDKFHTPEAIRVGDKNAPVNARD